MILREHLRVTPFILLTFISGLFGFHDKAEADESRPLYVEVTELQGHTQQQQWHYKVQWKALALPQQTNLPNIVLPDSCQSINNPPVINHAVTLASQTLYRCSNDLMGQVISIDYANFNPGIASLIKITTLTGEQHTALLPPSQKHWQVPQAETLSQVAKDYTLLGMQHIWAGSDHLLFLVCLLWIAGSMKRILITVTGFTLAHSITLALSTLNILRVPIPPVEAAIALSIVFLATEIAKAKKTSLTWRYPIAVSSSFGLLHGFGFASALAEIGLPQTELLTGLLFFNVGVEMGQMLFIIVMTMLISAIRRVLFGQGIFSRLVPTVQGISVYSVGTMASYWLVERCAAFLPVNG